MGNELREELESKTVAELRALCKHHEIVGSSGKNKADLVALLSDAEGTTRCSLATADLIAPFRQALAQPEIRDRAGERLGPWCLLRPLGSGGMGAVWLAERADEAFQMLAAVKLIRCGFASPKVIARFKRERQFLADLKHPNIAHLHDGGTKSKFNR